MKFITTLLFSLIILSSTAQTVGNYLQLNSITTAFPFLQFSPDARSTGLGDVGVALSPDANSFHWNTANLGFSEDKVGLSASYSPWLRQLVRNLDFFYVSGFSKIGTTSRHSLGGSVRYLSNGSNFLLSPSGMTLVSFKSNDLEVLGGYAFRISEKSSIGANAKFIYSDMILGLQTSTLGISPAMAGAIDLSYGYLDENIMLGKIKSFWSWGVALSNLGNKSFYNNKNEMSFLPASLRIGTSLGLNVKTNHKVIASVDFNKLLVLNQEDNVTLNNVSAIENIYRSFSDSEEGFTGELKEFTTGVGVEYQFKGFLSLRTGYFRESPVQGNRKFLTFGAGTKFKSFGIDVSYLASLTQNNSLANTIRFSISYVFK